MVAEGTLEVLPGARVERVSRGIYRVLFEPGVAGELRLVTEGLSATSLHSMVAGILVCTLRVFDSGGDLVDAPAAVLQLWVFA